MMEPVPDRAAMIEAASRSLRQQIDHGAARDRPCSNGLFHDGAPGTIPAGSAGWQGIHTDEPRSMESAQRRIRSAENQHRMVSAARDGLPMGSTVASTPSTSALDNYPLEDEVEDDTAALTTPLEDATSRMFPTDFHPELKRPLSRKKDPSASAAAGLGAFAGPSKMTDHSSKEKLGNPFQWKAGAPGRLHEQGCLRRPQHHWTLGWATFCLVLLQGRVDRAPA